MGRGKSRCDVFNGITQGWFAPFLFGEKKFAIILLDIY
jgi:hypothetical protein